jgi:hypothetical protein
VLDRLAGIQMLDVHLVPEQMKKKPKKQEPK